MSIEKNRRILVIDDNAAIHDDFRKILTPDKPSDRLEMTSSALFGQVAPSGIDAYEIDSAMQGEEGWQKACHAREAGRSYALAFVDMRMPPGWDGLETTLKLWEADPSLQIVICSAFSDYPWEDLAERLRPAHRLLILKKPFEPIEVSQMAMALTEKWELSQTAQLRLEELEALVEVRTRELVQANEQLRADAEERKRAAEERLAKIHLEQERDHLQNAVRAMEQVLGVVGHELRTPLAGVRAMAELLLQQDARQAPELDVYLGSIHSEIVRMAGVVNNLLEVARLNSGSARWNWSTVCIEQVCEQAMDAVRPLIDQANVSVRCRVDPANLTMRGDADALCRLLVNLLSNAQKNTPQGMISIEAAATERDGSEIIRIAVSDTGEGMPSEVSERLGVAFALNAGVVGESHIRGSGLGLNICKGIAAAHGGEISVESRRGQGTLFIALLRADLPQPAPLNGAAQIVTRCSDE